MRDRVIDLLLWPIDRAYDVIWMALSAYSGNRRVRDMSRAFRSIRKREHV
jgi:hypothetical protein